jgi:16S rRNA (cytosine967-C5)-methyltransferase
LSAVTPARRAAFETLRRVFEDGAWADRALRSAAERAGLEGRERAQAQALAYGAVQRRGTSDHLIAALSGRSIRKLDPPLVAALRLGMFELLFADGHADHAAVDQAVRLAKGPGGRRRGAGLVNAVLRRAGRERDELLESLGDAEPAAAAVAHSVPPWLAELWWEELGAETARALLAAINLAPERAYRANLLRSSREEVLAELAAAGVEAHAAPADRAPAPAESLIVTGGEWGRVEELVAGGRLVPQSRGSALVAEILAPRPGERVLDLCAGPGIKATQIATALGGGSGLVCVERDPGRASELRELLGRCGAGEAEVIVADAAEAPVEGGFDAVLVDPPCSGLGTLASRPDARWRRSPAGIDEMAATAKRILRRGLAALGPGGRLVYSTCTISRRENEEVVAAADAPQLDDLGAAAGLEELRSTHDPRFLQTRADRDRTDGFFIARIRT